MFVADTAGSLITAIAPTLVIAAVTLYLLHWVIRSAVSAALRRHHIWLERRSNLPPGPTGAIGNGLLD